MEFKHITKEGTTPKGKHYIFIHACTTDKALRETVFKKLLSYEQGSRCCLWYTDVPEYIFTDEGRDKLADMAIFIPLITEDYFFLFEEKYHGKKPSDLFEDLKLRGVAVLPLLESAQLLPRFNRIFGELHAVALNLPDADQKTEEQLKRLVSDNELEERIAKEAFQGKLFLSYRKKDINEAKDVMKAIHDTDAAKAASIWFDEFLVAGRDFNKDIIAQLDDCDAMALAVTPNLLEEGNYVRETEYGEAITRGRDVLPVEAIPTSDSDLEDAFPGIKPRVNLHDKEALEDMLKEAGFSGVGSMSAFGEYLLGMAFFIPIGVEKDVERALRLLRSSADRGCVEANEQLGIMYLKGVGVKRDVDESIRRKKKAYELLMKEPVSRSNIRHINRLLYEFDGLPLLLKENDRINEANEIQQAFLDRIESSPFKDEDEFILYRVNALTDLANLFYEYDLATGREKNTDTSSSQPTSMADVMASLYGGGSSGPSDRRMREAERYADKAMALLDAYRGDDHHMATFLRVVTLDQYADLSKYKNDLRGAIRWKEKSKQLIEPLAEETGDLEHMHRSFQISNNLGLFNREGMMAARMYSDEYTEYRRLAIENLDDAVRKARQLERLSPDFRGSLVHALSNRSLMTSVASEKKNLMLECYEVYLKLLKDHDVSADVAWNFRGLGGEFSAAVFNITHFTSKNDRKPIFEKVYGTAPKGSGGGSGPSMRAGCLQWLILFTVIISVILQLTGAVDITGFLNEKLGPYGTWIAAGAVIFLYVLTCIPKMRK